MDVRGIFCGLVKAFDCVNHEILSVKLHFYEIQGISEDWFRSCLTNRRQQVEVTSPNSTQNFFPDWGTLKYGVSQGSVLGPLFFIIYTNDLPLRIHSVPEPILFADDTSVIISSRNFEDHCLVPNLVLNLDKTTIMKFTTKNSSHSTWHIGYKEKYAE